MEPHMKPITTGKEDGNYTLYYPIYTADNVIKINLDINLLVHVLQNKLHTDVTVSDMKREDIPILKISNIETKDKAKDIFNLLNKFFISLSLKKSINIYISWEVKDPEPRPFNIFPNWQEAVEAGWDTGNGENFEVDGWVDITEPCIVDESKKIVDAGVGRFSARNVTRPILKDDLMNSIVKEPLQKMNDRQILALNAFMKSFSLTDRRLCYLLIFISLEVLAGDHCKVTHYANRKNFVKLLSDYKNDILNELDPEHHMAFKPESIRDKLYNYRKEIAHKLNPDLTTPAEIYDAHRIAKACATAILKKIIDI